jgi:4-amino-4-deoxy-L-arabinose transferase-like glycosyltransferase
MIKVSDRQTNILALLILVLMLSLSVLSVKDDSATMDELVRIPSGSSYLTQRDFRFHFEDPPLIKDLSAIPLLFLNLNFPKEHPSWNENHIDGEWTFGPEFLYRSGNDADQILFWSRLPMILLLVFLGWFLFRWVKEIGGNEVALLTLTFFSFSPNFIAHGRLVGTDVAAALGLVLSFYYFLKFLVRPDRKNTIFVGIILGLSLLIKFSLVLLLPFFGVLILLFSKLNSKNLKDYIWPGVLILLISMTVIFLVYQLHLLNYPLEKQLEAMEAYLSFDGKDSLEELCFYMAKNSLLRPFSHYLFGFLVTVQREMHYGHYSPVGGTFLLGMLDFHYWYYFPVVYLIKVPLAFHFLTLISILSFIYFFKSNSFRKWTKKHFFEFSISIFIAIYLFLAIRGKVNIGLRHILPIFPFLYILVSLGIKNWIEKIKMVRLKRIALLLITVILLWYGISSLSSFPHYLSYFNELTGGSSHGYEYVVDSNLDWGQDLKRLAVWVKGRGIERIYVDYFGGGDVKYYLEEKGFSWYGACWWQQWSIYQGIEDFPRGNYLAVSATFLQNGRGKPKNGQNLYWGCYNWLNNYQPVAQIGNSIFVYYIN